MAKSVSDLFSSEQPKQQPSSFSNLLSILVVGIAIWMGWQWFNRPSPDRDSDGDRQDQGDKEPQSSGYVFLIHEMQNTPVVELDVVDAVKSYCQSQPGLEVRRVDEEDDTPSAVSLVEFAKSKGISPPCIIHKVDGKNRKAIAWPKEPAGFLEVLL